eukprot:154272_1
MAKNFVREKAQQINHEIVSDNKTPFDEENAALTRNISDILTAQLDEIKEGIDFLRNQDFKSAQIFYQTALRWRDDKIKFQDYIKRSFDKSLEARSTIVKSSDKIALYSLCISAGSLFHSNYGENYNDALKHVCHVLSDMNKDSKLKRDMASALNAKIYWKSEEKALLKSVICFTVRISSFLRELQAEISKNESDDSASNDSKNEILYNTALLNNLVQTELESNDSDAYERWDWMPNYWNGYYFGNVGQYACNYSVLSKKEFEKIMV